MAGLRPIGSEKLTGKDKINRIIEISRYKENIPKPINENKSVEYSITLTDGNQYQIVKEKSGYVIKKSLNESRDGFDYIEPMKNRRYYSSYSEAFKRLNLITKEVNTLTGYDKNISLFNESDDAKKYVLKMKEQAATPSPAPSLPPSPSPEPETPPISEPELPEPEMGDMEDSELELPEPEMGDMEDEDEEVVTFKTIQKITGKLGQKIRAFLSDENNQMSSKDIKYVINSVLSSLDLNDLEEEDKEDILSKFEGESVNMGIEEPELPEPEMGDMEEPEPELPEPEMGDMEEPVEEDYDFEEPKYPKHPRHRKLQFRNSDDDDVSRMEEMIEGIFTESKVDKVLRKYFKIDENEMKYKQQKKERLLEEKKNKIEMKNKISRLSENITQEVSSIKFISKNPDAKLLGKTKEKSLVFSLNENKILIKPSGVIK